MEFVLLDGTKCLIDDEDFERLNQYKWGLVKSKTGSYAARGTRSNGVYRKILMHKELLPCLDKKLIVDHINGNKLDNRKQNLRIVTRSQNLQNSKKRNDSNNKYKGVRKQYKDKYCARIQIDKNTRLYLGYFNSEIEAAKAYDEAAKKYFGEYAQLNFKESNDGNSK
jgi:HNH endonuclease/AP2 domain